MSLNWNEKVRPAVLGGLCLCVTAASLWTLLAPKPLTKPKPPHEFTAAFAPPGWNLLPATDLPPSSAVYQSDDGNLTVQLRYVDDLRVEHTVDPDVFTGFLPWDCLPLDIRTHYLVNLRGRMRANAKTDSVDVQSEIMTIRHRNQIGFSDLWRDGHRFHFSSVVCPVGESAALRPQFSHNLYVKQLSLAEISKNRFHHGFPLDSRAITLDVFIAEGVLSSTEAEKTLETAGFDWIQWCSQHFPSS